MKSTNEPSSKAFWSQGPDEIEHTGAVGGGWNHHLSFLSAAIRNLRLKLSRPSLVEGVRLDMEDPTL